jgi:nucleoside-diphosphate-sugar epimerase
VARVLIVGCGCRGRDLAAALAGGGHAVRGTSRHPRRLPAIHAVGAQAVVADPDRLSTVMTHLEGVSVLCWLMGTAVGEREAVAAIHGSRLESMLAAIVDTPVRAFVYEAAGSVDPAVLQLGRAIARQARDTYRMLVEVVDADPRDRGAWLGGMLAAVERVLSA